MATQSAKAFTKLLDTLFFGSLDKRDKGDKFERLIRSYLLTDPAWATQFSDVWLWNDYPGRNNRPDTGIDLVAKNTDTGELTAIQCKFLDPQTTVSKADIDSFLAASSTNEFSRRLLVSTSLKWSKHAENALKNLTPPLTRLNFNDLATSPIDWTQFSLDTPEELIREDNQKTLRPHQRKALTKVTEGFTHHDRGKLIMACGTGKTYTALQILEHQTPTNSTTLFLVPSIALLSQTLTEWKHDATTPFRALAVCSDSKVGRNTEDDISTTDLIVPATTDPARLVESQMLAADYQGRTIVFSTYQSIEVIAQAQQQGFPEFDLIICDEAHRTTGATLAGEEESAFTRIHDENFIKGAKRLYMTATPRVFDESTKAKADENSVVVASMDDEKLFGPEFYYLGFGEAVEQNLLTDYKVLVLAVDEKAVNTKFQNLLTDEDGELRIDDVARLVGCWNGLATRGTENLDSEKPVNIAPMQRAVAFSSNIRESKRVAQMIPAVTEELAQNSQHDLVCAAEHVDGGMNIALRNQKLSWLKETPEPGTCRILTNARCLSEGVDVPSLDAVLFLNPRNSQVDVVQSVGRVMRKSPGKDYGYIILPVGIPTGMTPEQALKDSKRYKVIWSVLNALRSHDDRFEAMVNKIDLNERRDDKLQIIGVGTGEENPDTDTGLGNNQQLTLDLEFPGVDEWRDAIYAKIVQKVGDREYWENWSKTIADVAARHTDRIQALVTQEPSPEINQAFTTFVEALKANLNDGISTDDAVSMLSQHLITKPVFDALFEGYDFAANNPVSQVMQTMIDTLEGNNLSAETTELNDFYASVARRAAGIENPEGKQRIITELYENFFKQAFPKQAQALGVVYTPIEIVDFIIRSVDHLSQKHFEAGITDEGVHILDPFTGTGTFIVRLLESGIITPHDLARKYANELHANEIMLLAYYIAAINIEATYHGLSGENYKPFNGIVLADTFQMSEDGDTLDTKLFTHNNERAQRQLDTDIRIIIGNPPYSAGQKSASDFNANQSYTSLDSRIAETYVMDTAATLRNSLYDSYIRAIRWGTDRIGNKGILAYVTNGGYIDSNTASGLRKHLTQDFTHLYIYNLRGNAMGSGELRKRESGNVFGAGTRTTVGILVGIKDPTHTGPCQLFYRDIGDYLNREEKLAIVAADTIPQITWENITPSKKNEWINQSSQEFDNYFPLGDNRKNNCSQPIFLTYSSGLKTNRDAWVYNYSSQTIIQNIKRMSCSFDALAQTYAHEAGTPRTAKDALSWIAKNSSLLNPREISWTRGLGSHLAKSTKIVTSKNYLRDSIYRPFSKQKVYFYEPLNEHQGQLNLMFPTSDHENYVICVVAPSSASTFTVLAVDEIPCLDLLGRSGQCFSRYTYVPDETSPQQDFFSSSEDSVAGYQRIDNISDKTLIRYQQAFGKEVSKDDIFASIYALLHSPQYQSVFSADLKRQLPRIPLPKTSEDFQTFSRIGKRLMFLHTNYEAVTPYPLKEERSLNDDSNPEFYEVQKLTWAGKTRTPDKSTIIYNDNLTLSGIPDQAHEYMLGSRSALEWVIDRYQVSTHKASGIINDPNDWGKEHGNPRYIVDLIKKVTAVSVETMKLIQALPELDLS